MVKLLYNYIKSLFFPVVFFLFSCYFYFGYEYNDTVTKVDRPLSQAERGDILISFLVDNTPGGIYTYGSVFFILGLLLLRSRTIRFMDRIKSKNYEWYSKEELRQKEKEQEEENKKEINRVNKEIKKRSVDFKRRF